MHTTNLAGDRRIHGKNPVCTITVDRWTIRNCRKWHRYSKRGCFHLQGKTVHLLSVTTFTAIPKPNAFWNIQSCLSIHLKCMLMELWIWHTCVYATERERESEIGMEKESINSTSSLSDRRTLFQNLFIRCIIDICFVAWMRWNCKVACNKRNPVKW